MEDFHTKIDAEKHKRIGNLSREKEGFFGGGRDFDEEAVRRFFESKNVNPETIANFFQANKKNGDHLEGMFPQLEFENNSEKIMSEIRESAPNGFRSPDDLLATIAQYIKSKMSYDLLTVLFDKPGEENYTNMIRQTMRSPNAKFAISNKEKDNLMYFSVNLQTNGRFSPREGEIITNMSIYGKDIHWLRDQAVNNPEFQKLLKKISSQYGAFLYNSQKE